MGTPLTNGGRPGCSRNGGNSFDRVRGANSPAGSAQSTPASLREFRMLEAELNGQGPNERWMNQARGGVHTPGMSERSWNSQDSRWNQGNMNTPGGNGSMVVSEPSWPYYDSNLANQPLASPPPGAQGLFDMSPPSFNSSGSCNRTPPSGMGPREAGLTDMSIPSLMSSPGGFDPYSSPPQRMFASPPANMQRLGDMSMPSFASSPPSIPSPQRLADVSMPSFGSSFSVPSPNGFTPPPKPPTPWNSPCNKSCPRAPANTPEYVKETFYGMTPPPGTPATPASQCMSMPSNFFPRSPSIPYSPGRLPNMDNVSGISSFSMPSSLLSSPGGFDPYGSPPQRMFASPPSNCSRLSNQSPPTFASSPASPPSWHSPPPLPDPGSAPGVFDQSMPSFASTQGSWVSPPPLPPGKRTPPPQQMNSTNNSPMDPFAYGPIYGQSYFGLPSPPPNQCGFMDQSMPSMASSPGGPYVPTPPPMELGQMTPPSFNSSISSGYAPQQSFEGLMPYMNQSPPPPSQPMSPMSGGICGMSPPSFNSTGSSNLMQFSPGSPNLMGFGGGGPVCPRDIPFVSGPGSCSSQSSQRDEFRQYVQDVVIEEAVDRVVDSIAEAMPEGLGSRAQCEMRDNLRDEMENIANCVLRGQERR